MIKTSRLIIRRFTPEDWVDLHEYLSDPTVVFYEPYDVFTKDESIKEAARRAENEAFWAVCLRNSDKLIGNIYLAEGDFFTWELGFVFNSAYQGCGYAFEAASALVEYAFSVCGAHRITAMCNPDNIKSWHLLERLGMRREGHLRDNIYFNINSDNKPLWQDTYEYALLTSEYGAARS
jgi:Acetyltransferases, including N-acetylases of ribosomal proteins